MPHFHSLPYVFLPRIAAIIYLDNDKPTLRALQLSCKEGWATTTPLLYKRIRISEPSQWQLLLPENLQWYASHPEATLRKGAAFSHVITLEVDALPTEDGRKVAEVFATLTHKDTLFPNAINLSITSRALNPEPSYEPDPRHLQSHLDQVKLLLDWISPKNLCLQSPEGRPDHHHTPLPSSFVIPFPKIVSIEHHCPSETLQLPFVPSRAKLELERVHFDPVPPADRIDFSWVVEKLRMRAEGVVARLEMFDRFRVDEKHSRRGKIELVNSTVFARGTQDDEYSRVLSQRMEHHVGELYHRRTDGQSSSEVEVIYGIKKVMGLKVHPAKAEILCPVCGCS